MGLNLNLQKLNNLVVGILIGLITPTLFFYFLVLPDYSKFKFTGEHFNKMMVILLPVLLSRCIFPNVLFFFLFLWRDYVKAAKGVLISTVALTAILIIIKFI